MAKIHKEYIWYLVILATILIFFSDDRVPHAYSKSPELTGQSLPVTAPQEVSRARPQVEGKGSRYIEITTSCDDAFQGICANIRSGPGSDYAIVDQTRKGAVFKVGEEIQRNGETWYRIAFDEWLRYPERVSGSWYVHAGAGRTFYDSGTLTLSSSTQPTEKRIVVDRSEQMLYAYDGDKLFMRVKVSTGVAFTPTPRGTFKVFKKMPSRYMQGPLPGVNDSPFDLPGTPWNLYFTEGGAVIHGAYWHDRYGTEQSSGCVNLPPEIAEILYHWAELGTTVTVK